MNATRTYAPCPSSSPSNPSAKRVRPAFPHILEANFADLCRQLMREQLGDLGKDLYAFGNTRLFLRNEIVAVIEEARMKAQAKKETAARYAQDCYAAFLARRRHSPRMDRVRKLQWHWRKRREKRTTFLALRLALKAEQAFIRYRTEKRRTIEEAAAALISQTQLSISVRNIILTGIRARKLMLPSLLRLSGRRKLERVVAGIAAMSLIWKRAWSIACLRMRTRAARTLVQTCKGHLARRTLDKEIRRAREIAYIML